LADGLASDVASMNCSDIVIPNEVNAAKAVAEYETRLPVSPSYHRSTERFIIGANICNRCCPNLTSVKEDSNRMP